MILTHELDGTVQGLKDFPKDQRPPVAIPYFAFRIMVGIGLVMLAIVVISWVLRVRRDLFITDWYLRLCQYAAPLGFVAVIAGWCVTEVGRQPWTVYGHMRTADSVTPSLTTTDVALSLAGYIVVYLIMYPAGVMLLWRIIKRGPAEQKDEAVESGRPRSPVDALPLAERHGEGAP